MTIAWKSPKHCGGSKIKAYYIDRRDADSLVWKEVNQAAVTERICTVRMQNAHARTHAQRHTQLTVSVDAGRQSE